MARVTKGFSLVELSIVLVIIGILVVISLSLGSGQINVANIKSTQNKLDRIDQAIALYFKTNGALPCPAEGTTASGVNFGVAPAASGGLVGKIANITSIAQYNPITFTAPGHGFSNGDTVVVSGVTGMTNVNGMTFTVGGVTTDKFTGGINSTGFPWYTGGGIAIRGYSDKSCAGITLPTAPTSYYYVGIVPVRTLGLNDSYAYDAWGRRITYAVSKHCIDSDNWNNNNTYKCTDNTGSVTADGGNLTINDLSGAGGGSPKAPTGTVGTAGYVPGAAYVVMSMGKNGYGAFSRAGLKESSATRGAKEVNNASTTYTTAVFNDGFINDGNQPNFYFDDIVHWKTAARMWDDVSATVTVPSCAIDQMLVSNGGMNYTCTDDNTVIDTESVNAPNNSSYRGPYPGGSYSLTDPTKPWFGARYFFITGICNDSPSSGANAPKAYATITYKIIDSAGNIYSGTACDAHDYSKAGVLSLLTTDTDTKFVRLPKGATNINVTMDWNFNQYGWPIDPIAPGWPARYSIGFMK